MNESSERRGLCTVLLATDGSPDALRATTAAIDVAAAHRAQLRIACVAPTVMPSPSGFHPVIVPPEVFDAANEQAQSVVDAACAAARAGGVATVSGEALVGPPVGALLAHADEVGADLIVIGSRGHGAMARLVLGSVSEGVLHGARCPVLVVRGHGAAWPEPQERAAVPARDDAERSVPAGTAGPAGA